MSYACLRLGYPKINHVIKNIEIFLVGVIFREGNFSVNGGEFSLRTFFMQGWDNFR